MSNDYEVRPWKIAAEYMANGLFYFVPAIMMLLYTTHHATFIAAVAIGSGVGTLCTIVHSWDDFDELLHFRELTLGEAFSLVSRIMLALVAVFGMVAVVISLIMAIFVPVAACIVSVSFAVLGLGLMVIGIFLVIYELTQKNNESQF